MAKRKWKPPVRLEPEIYDEWIAENPKMIEEGPLELKPCPLCGDVEAVNLEAHHVFSGILPDNYADTLCIYGIYNEFEGFKIYVTPTDFDYLLMAHQHHNGQFISDDGRKLNDHPHFHQLNYDRRSSGGPGTKRIVPIGLSAGMNPADLLEIFLNHYDFNDGRSIAISMPEKLIVQSGLGDFI